MLKELYNNRYTILKNYYNLLYNNRKWIIILALSLFLLIIYALLSIKEYKLTIQKQLLYKHKQHEEFKNYKQHTSSTHLTETFSNSNSNDTEDTNNTNTINLQFISDTSNTNLINYINTVYLIHMNSVNSVARNFTTITELKNKYNTALLSTITETDKVYLTTSVNNNINTNKLTDKQHKWLVTVLNNTEIAKTQPWLEMNMPHTHANVILFNNDMFNTFNWSTFIHECVHIDQRINYNNYKALYYKWGFMYIDINTVKGLEHTISRNRLNPDAIDCNWIWKSPVDNNKYWIGVVFNSITPDNLGDVSYIALKIDMDNSGNYYYNGTDSRNLNIWVDFQNYFGIKNNHYHPNEIIAEYMGYYFNNNHGIIGNLKTKKGYGVFIDWYSDTIIV